VETSSVYAAIIIYSVVGFLVAEGLERAERKRGKDLGSGYLVFFLLWPGAIIIALIIAFNSQRT
jgi:hypothetical protein